MRVRKHTMTLIACLFACLFVLGGCETIVTDISVEKSGAVTMRLTEKIDKELYMEFLTELYGSAGLEGGAEDILDQQMESGNYIEEVIDGRTYLVGELGDDTNFESIEAFYQQNGMDTGMSLTETSLRVITEPEEQNQLLEEYLGSRGLENTEYIEKYLKTSYLELSVSFGYPVKTTNGIVDADNPNQVAWKISMAEDLNEIYAECDSSIHCTGIEAGALYDEPVTLNFEGAESATLSGGQVLENGTVFSADGNYSVILKNGDEQKTICFAVDRKIPPAITDASGTEVAISGWLKKEQTIYLQDSNGVESAKLDGMLVLDCNLNAAEEFVYSVTLNPDVLLDGKHTLTVSDIYGNSKSVTFKTDKTAPIIKGIKNGKSYKKAVTVKYSDAGIGVRKALLNGKAVKSGKKVTKAGNYTLKVTDKNGNTAKVKFKIKKKVATAKKTKK